MTAQIETGQIEPRQIGASPSWDQTLRDLEHDLELAERMLANGEGAHGSEQVWTPPTGLGPVPGHLMDHARDLLARQLDVARRLAAAAGDSRRHDRALSQLAQDAPRPPVYLDTPA